MTSTRVRFAPSPTGSLHLGSAMTAIANYAFARATGGAIILRVDDTDVARSRDEYEHQLVSIIDWLGIGIDDGLENGVASIRQSERSHLHARAIEDVLKSGSAYHCFCTEQRLNDLHAAQRAANKPPRYDGLCRNLSADEVAERSAAGEESVVRLRVDEARDWTFTDIVRGDVRSPAGNFSDFILRRSDGGVGYQFASAFDDADMQITHVLRGEDHLPNTPRQIAIWEALGATVPQFAHLPLLLSDSGKKLSKRDPMGTVEELREGGFPAQALWRYAFELLGQGASTPVTDFTLETVQATSPHVSYDRLKSLAVEIMVERPLSQVITDLRNGGLELPAGWEPVVDDIRQGAVTIQEILDQLQVLVEPPSDVRVDEDSQWVVKLVINLINEEQDVTRESAVEMLAKLRARAKEDGLGAGSVLKPLRYALTGQQRGPHLDLIIAAIGREEALSRLDAALLMNSR